MMADIDLGLSDGSDEDGEAMTAAEVLHKMEEAWLNEKFSPELLECQTDVVECMLEQIQEMEENIHRAKKGDFKVSLHRMEIDRIRFMISGYLRCRLKKIEKFAVHILENESVESPRLSPDELQFAKEYQASMDSHLKLLALRHMPQNLQKLDPKQTAVCPNMDSYVFLKVQQTVEGVVVEEETTDASEEIIDMEKGNQHILRYRTVAPLVMAGSVSLI